MGSRTSSWRREIGERVRGLRQRAGLSQSGLASRAGLSKMAVSRVERGDGGRLETIERLAGALGVSGSELVRAEHRMRPTPAPFSSRVVRVAVVLDQLDDRDLRAVEALARALRHR